MITFNKIKDIQLSIQKRLNWEYWSVYSYYIPLLPYVFYQVFKSKHSCFFYSANPGIFHSGSGVESKYKTLQIIPPEYRPKMAHAPRHSTVNFILKTIKKAGINFPLIAKPDVGYRGYLVQLLKNVDELKTYISKFNEIDIIFQEYIAYKNECGIFYTRKPSELSGKISSITLKKFRSVQGDGHSTLEELILNDEQAFIYIDIFRKIHAKKISQVIEAGESFQLTIVGNHSKGTQFLNGNHLIDPQLTKAIDKICKQIKGFNYGRLDIKYQSFDDLKQGKNLKILEANGIISEPTHVWDSTSEKSGYWNTLKEQIRHWSMLSDIAREHHELNNVPYHPFSALIKDLFWIKKHSKRLKALNKL